MKCPVCGTSLPLQSDRCPGCGFRCKTSQEQPPKSPPTGSTVSSVPYTPPNKSKRFPCCCCALILVVPILIVAITAGIFAFGSITWDFSAEFFEDIYEEIPIPGPSPESLPEAADEGCFAVADHTLMFLADNWDGSPILRIPDTIAGEEIISIGVGCFAGCEELTTIFLPDTVTVISPMAFSGCTGLRGLYLPDGVELIGKDAFAMCRSLEAIYIPASVATIAPGCFDDCASLRYIFYGGTFEDWSELYSDYITPFTAAICLDGEYYHGAWE